MGGASIDFGMVGGKEVFPSPFAWSHATVVIMDGHALTVRAKPDDACTLEFQPEVLGGGVSATADGVTGTIYFADFGSHLVRSSGDCERWTPYLHEAE